MTIYYSATTNAFYDSQVYNVNNIPEDKVAVAESTYKNLMAQQCAGRVIVAAADGTPTTIVQTCGPCTSTKYATKTELTNGLAAKANDSNVVHKTGDEHINGVKSFGGVIKATNGTVQVGADTGYSVTFNYNGNITSKQASGTYKIALPKANGTLAIDDNLVHKTGDETISGTKTFSNTIHRYADLTTSGYAQVYRFDDTNANACGHIYNNVHWYNNAVYNRHGAYNAKSGKSMEIDIISRDSGDGMVYVAGTASKGNVETVTSETGHTGIATMGWVNNPATSTNVVHRSGDESINGVKMFKNCIYRQADISTSTVETVYVLEDTNAKPCGSIYNKMHWYNNNVYNRHQSYNAASGKDMYLEILSDNDGSGIVSTGGSVTNNKNLTTVTNGTNNSYVATMGWVNNPATSTNVVHRTGDETINGTKTFTDGIHKKNSTLDLQVNPSANQHSGILFNDKNNATMGYLEHVQTTKGVNVLGLITRDKNHGSHGIKVTSEDTVIPLGNGVVNLGLSEAKWKNVYAINIHTSNIDTKYFTYTHDGRTSYSYLPKTSGTLAIQERTRASAVVENRTLLYECVGGLDLGDIVLNDMYTKYNALVIVYSNDDGGGISTYYLDCAELDIRREVAGSASSATFLLVDGHSWWACTGASTGTKFVHSKNNGLRIHKIYGLAKFY